MWKKLLLTGVFLLILDGIYLTSMTDYFNRQIISVQGSRIKMNVLGTILCYIFIIGGLYYFIIKPRRSILDAFYLGIFVYGVYELTTISLLKNWKYQTVIMDTLWGGILFAATTYAISLVKGI